MCERGSDREKWSLLCADEDSDRMARFLQAAADTQPETTRGNNPPQNCTVDIIPPKSRTATEPPQIIADNVIWFPCDAAWFDAVCVWGQWFLAIVWLWKNWVSVTVDGMLARQEWTVINGKPN